MARTKPVTEEMKAAIRNAAAALFADKGYAAVTMREIARAAGCSHTAIYLYFKNKEDLLQQLAIPYLQELEARMIGELERNGAAPRERLAAVCREYAVFCLTHGSFSNVLIISGAGRVDETDPELELNRIRNRLFSHLARAANEAANAGGGSAPAEEALARARVLFYYLQGYVQTYLGSEEPIKELLERTLPTFRRGIDLLVAGIHAEETRKDATNVE